MEEDEDVSNQEIDKKSNLEDAGGIAVPTTDRNGKLEEDEEEAEEGREEMTDGEDNEEPAK